MRNNHSSYKSQTLRRGYRKSKVLIKDLLPFLLQKKSANVKPKQKAKPKRSPKKSKRKRKVGRELLQRAIILDQQR